MSGGRRAKRSSTGRAMASRSPDGRRGGPGPRARILAGLIVFFIVAAAVFAWSRFMDGRAPARTSARSVQASDAAGFARAGRAAETRLDYATALATYRDGLKRFPNDEILLGSYATAIKNASFAVRPSRGRLVPVAANSHERVGAALEAIALLEAAQRARPQASQAPLQKGLLYAAWGLPEDALVELYGAVTRGDRSPELERTATAITLLQMGRGSEVDQKGSPASR